MHQQVLRVKTGKRGTYEITRDIAACVADSGVIAGLCNIYIKHTSASLIVCENADPTVRLDLENFLARAIPDGDSRYHHDMEGPDDMPAHIRTVLTQVSLTIPIMQQSLAMGTWQGIYVYEHRYHAEARDVLVTVQD